VAAVAGGRPVPGKLPREFDAQRRPDRCGHRRRQRDPVRKGRGSERGRPGAGAPAPGDPADPRGHRHGRGREHRARGARPVGGARLGVHQRGCGPDARRRHGRGRGQGLRGAGGLLTGDDGDAPCPLRRSMHRGPSAHGAGAPGGRAGGHRRGHLAYHSPGEYLAPPGNPRGFSHEAAGGGGAHRQRGAGDVVRVARRLHEAGRGRAQALARPGRGGVYRCVGGLVPQVARPGVQDQGHLRRARRGTGPLCARRLRPSRLSPMLSEGER
jgi:hypothetical protein